MKSIVASILCFLPALAVAAPFDGTWVMDPASVAWVSAVPESYVLQGGRFTCGVGACSPTFTIPADGRPHSVEGHAYNSVVVTVVNARTVTVSGRVDGAQDWESTYSVAEDGHTMTEHIWAYEGRKSGTSRITYSRTAAGERGSHAISGSWVSDPKSMVFSAALATVSYRETANGLQMSDPLGDNYDARFDGKQYTTKGDPEHTRISIERLGARTIRQTNRIAGKVRTVSTMEVAEDGRTMRVLQEDKQTGASMKYVLKKMP
jgi:hypothetical protein